MVPEINPDGQPNVTIEPSIPPIVGTNKDQTPPPEKKKRKRKKVDQHTYSPVIGNDEGKRDDSYGPEDYS